MTTVYFDICETLGTLQVSPNKNSNDLIVEEIYPFPRTTEVLTLLSNLGFKLGIMSNSGVKYRNAVDNALKTSGLKEFFKEEGLLIYDGNEGLEPNTRQIFELAINRSGENAADCYFVGDDRFERMIAHQLGMGVSPHPLLTKNVIDGEKLQYVSIKLKAQAGSDEAKRYSTVVSSAPIVPLMATREDGDEVIAIAAESGFAQSLSKLQTAVDSFDSISPDISDLFLVRRDPAIDGWEEDFLPKIEKWRLKYIVDGVRRFKNLDDGILIALPGNVHIDDFHPRNAQHGHTQKLISTDQLVDPYGFWHSSKDENWLKQDSRIPALSKGETKVLKEEIKGGDGGSIDQHVNRYAGDAESRHSRNPGNKTAVRKLVDDFQRIGKGDFRTRLYAFKMEWQILCNVEAELDGESEEVVITSAHLDSTAKFTHEGTRKTSPAPGADDDASGMAGVLAISQALKKLSEQKNQANRKIRFVLFNAEEQGLIGSQKYAKYQRDRRAEIVGVFQMDMIGYNKDNSPSWELHAGCLPYSNVQDRSIQLIELVKRLQPSISGDLEAPQVYLSPFYFHYDPAEGRSDHSPFHKQGYAACLASEDFFAGPRRSDPERERNPNYHTENDKIVNINTEYAADIARVVGAAVWIKANSAVV